MSEERKLNQLGQDLQDEFEINFSDGGCSCHISPPCGYCVHPGNPSNLEETLETWEKIMEKNIEVEFEIGEEVITRRKLNDRASGYSEAPLNESKAIKEILLTDGKHTKYRVEGSWMSGDQLIRKEDAQKEALRLLVSRIEFVSGLSE